MLRIIHGKKELRSSNFEVLRIVSIVLIIFHHFSLYGCSDIIEQQTLTAEKIFVQILSSGGKLGVNCFLLISGYFLVNKAYSFKKMLKLILQVFFYALLSLIIASFLGNAPQSMMGIIKSLMPISFDIYGFAATYLVLYILSPFLNILIDNMTKETYKRFILVIGILWCVIPTFTSIEINLSNLGWFIYIYFIGAYIRRHPLTLKSSKFYIGVSICSCIVVELSIVCMDLAGLIVPVIGEKATFFTGLNKLPLLLCSVSLFVGISKWKAFQSHTINAIASTCFGVFLFHMSPLIMYEIWNRLLHVEEYKGTAGIFIFPFVAIPIIFCLGMLIDFARIYLLEKPIFWGYDKIERKIKSKRAKQA